MFLDLFNFYPFNVRSGFEFLFLYAVFGAIGLVILTMVRRTYGSHLDAVAAQSILAVKRLTIGVVPSTDQYYAIAMLKNGTAGVVDTIIAIAHSAGCLRPKPEGDKNFLVSLEPGMPDHAILKSFLDRLIQPGSSPPVEVTPLEVRTAAGNTASEYRETLRKELAASGMERTPQTQGRVVNTLWLLGMIILSFGTIRLGRAVLMGHKFLFLVIEMAVFAVWIYTITQKTKDSALKEPYLEWLKDSTASLRLNVSSGWSTTTESVGLGVAIDGAAILGTAAVTAGLVYAFMPNYGVHTAQAHTVHSHTTTSSSGGADISGGDWGSTWDSGGSSSCSSGSGGTSSCSSGSGGSSSCSSGSGGGDSGGGGGGCGGGGGGCGGGGGGCGGGGGGCGGGG